MSRSLHRAVVSLILAPYIALSGALPPEHAHEADADHPHSTVHRHVQPHAVGSHDRDHTQLADDDGHVVWLDNATLTQPAYQFAASAFPPADRFELAPPVTDWVARPACDATPPHGPPRTYPALRAPPSLSS